MGQSRETSLQRARVLIVEDEYFLADDLARALRDAGAQPVGPASSVKQAEELMSREHLDAAILDLNLRGEVASGFVERLASTDLPCVIVSGYAPEAVPESVSEVPRIEKPVSPSSVLSMLSAELSRVH